MPRTLARIRTLAVCQAAVLLPPFGGPSPPVIMIMMEPCHHCVLPIVEAKLPII